MKKQKIKRFFYCLAITFLFLCAMPVRVLAAGNLSPETQGNLEALGETILEWYSIARSVAVPLAILSFGSCGFRILSSIFMAKGEYTYDAALRQFLYTGLSLAIIILLPWLTDWVSGIAERYAWRP